MVEKKKSKQAEIRNKIAACLFLKIPTTSQVRGKEKKKERENFIPL